jgi:hypothetical protein
MTGQDVINLVRYQVRDYQDVQTSPFDKWNAINAGNRFIRRIALEAKPSILNATETANLVIGTSEYTLTKVPNKVTEVRVDGKTVSQVDVQSIVDLTKTGTPTVYYLSAYNKITFYPIPDAILAYSVRMVEASTDWAEATTIPWNQDIVDFIVEYAIGVLTGSLNQQYIKQEVRKLLGNIEEQQIGVSSYWDVAPKGSDY